MVSRFLRGFRRPKMDVDCEEVRRLSSDYIDAELEQSSAGKVRGHLERCGPCSAFINTLRATVELLSSIGKRRADGGFRRRVRESIARESRQ